jgi:hypothetical protein
VSDLDPGKDDMSDNLSLTIDRLENGAGSFVQSILEAHEEKIQEKFTDSNRLYGHMNHNFASLIVMVKT